MTSSLTRPQSSLVATAVLLVASAALLPGCRTSRTSIGPIERTQTDGSPYAACGSERIERVARLANRARSDRGRPPLHCAPELSRVAEAHADDMCEHRYLSHRGRDGSTPADRATEAGIQARAFGENIARGQPDPDRVHDGWMGSPRHRKNILREVFSRIGVAYVECRGRPIWVQVFAN